MNKKIYGYKILQKVYLTPVVILNHVIIINLLVVFETTSVKPKQHENTRDTFALEKSTRRTLSIH